MIDKEKTPLVQHKCGCGQWTYKNKCNDCEKMSRDEGRENSRMGGWPGGSRVRRRI
ncbi:unnamed protein product [marine sediment metagenome]|uniref:Uncharacterized protein n=1 Tax=marine sediment metagenome TaxID=412755 RepID=X0XV47_9ZZZZ